MPGLAETVHRSTEQLGAAGLRTGWKQHRPTESVCALSILGTSDCRSREAWGPPTSIAHVVLCSVALRFLELPQHRQEPGTSLHQVVVGFLIHPERLVQPLFLHPLQLFLDFLSRQFLNHGLGLSVRGQKFGCFQTHISELSSIGNEGNER